MERGVESELSLVVGLVVVRLLVTMVPRPLARPRVWTCSLVSGRSRGWFPRERCGRPLERYGRPLAMARPPLDRATVRTRPLDRLSRPLDIRESPGSFESCGRPLGRLWRPLRSRPSPEPLERLGRPLGKRESPETLDRQGRALSRRDSPRLLERLGLPLSRRESPEPLHTAREGGYVVGLPLARTGPCSGRPLRAAEDGSRRYETVLLAWRRVRGQEVDGLGS